MKKIISLILSVLLLVSLASAANFPHPIHGHITQGAVAVANLDIKVQNLDSGASSTYRTDYEGFYIVDLGNIDDRYRESDSIKVSLAYCESSPQCSGTVKVSGGENKLDFDILSLVQSNPLPPSATLVKFVCWDNTAVDDSSKCSVKPEPIIPEPTVVEKEVTKEVEKVVEKPVEKIIVQEKIFCEDGTQVLDPGECPSDINSIWGYIIELLAVVLVGVGWAKGFLSLARYYWKKGEETKNKELSLKYKKRAITMAKTAFAKAVAGDYAKKLKGGR